MFTHSNGLCAIILHHSYLKNLRCKIACDGHSNISGKNGAGKTSALRLVPVFYGLAPRRLMDMAGNKDNFLSYYLPALHSMVIFEYRRKNRAGEQETCCVVLYRSNDGKLTFRFVKGTPEATLFRPELDEAYAQCKSTVEILKMLSRWGTEMSEKLNQREYAAIISNQRRELKERKLRDYAVHFALPSVEMQHMGELTSVLLQVRPGQLLNHLKVMLSDALIEKNLLSANPSDPRTIALISDIRTLNAFQNITAELENGIEKARSIKEAGGNLRAYRDEAARRENDARSDAQAQEQELKALRTKYEQDCTHANETRKTLTAQRAESEGEQNAAERLCQRLEQEREEWHRQDIQDKERQWEGIDEVRQRQKSAEAQLTLLNQSHREILEAYEQHKRELQEHLREREQDLARRREAHNEKRKAQQTQERQDLDALHQRQQQEREAQQARHKEILAPFRERLEAAQAQARNAQMPTPEERKAQQRLEQERSTMTEACAQAEAAWDKAQHQERQAYKAELRAQEACRQAQQKAQSCAAEVQKISNLLQQGTLREFLQRSGRPWTPIAQLINPELLQRSDLSPEWRDDGESFYGLSLNTELLPFPQEAQSNEQIGQRLAEAQARAEKAAAQAHSAQKEQEAAQKAHRQAREETQAAAQKLKDLKEQLQFLAAEEKKLRRQHEAAGQARAQSCDAAIEEAQTAWKQEQAQQDGATAALSKRQRAESDEFQKRLAESEQADQKDRDEFQKQAAQIRSDERDRLANLESARKAALKEQKVDEEALEKARGKVQELAAQLKKLAGYEKIIREFRTWVEVKWSQYEAYRQNAEHWRAQVQALRDQEKALNAECSAQEQRFKSQEQALKQRHEKAEKDTQKWAEWVRKLAAAVAVFAQPPTVAGDYQLIENDGLFEQICARALEQWQTNTAELRRTVTAAKTLFGKQGGELNAQWQNRLSARGLNEYEHDLNYDLAAMEELDEMLHRDIPQKKASCCGNFVANANAWKSFTQGLKAFGNNLARLSRALSEEINAGHSFDNLTAFKLDIHADLSRGALVRALTQFSERYEDYDDAQLPDEELLARFEEVDRLLGAAEIDLQKIDRLIDLNLSFSEQGRQVFIRRDEDLLNSSSTGLSLIIIVILFSGLTRYLCPDAQTRIHWPLDEVERLDPGNIRRLFALMDKHNIALFCAQPKLDALGSLFVCKNDIDPHSGIRHYQSEVQHG